MYISRINAPANTQTQARYCCIPIVPRYRKILPMVIQLQIFVCWSFWEAPQSVCSLVGYIDAFIYWFNKINGNRYKIAFNINTVTRTAAPISSQQLTQLPCNNLQKLTAACNYSQQLTTSHMQQFTAIRAASMQQFPAIHAAPMQQFTATQISSQQLTTTHSSSQQLTCSNSQQHTAAHMQ